MLKLCHRLIRLSLWVAVRVWALFDLVWFGFPDDCDVQPGLGACALDTPFHCFQGYVIPQDKSTFHSFENSHDRICIIFLFAPTGVPTCPYIILPRKESKGVGQKLG